MAGDEGKKSQIAPAPASTSSSAGIDVSYTEYAFLILRVSLGITLSVLGFMKLGSPTDWIVHVPVYIGQWSAGTEISIFRLLRLLGLVECLLGIQLALGLFTRLASAVSAILLFLIVIHLGLSDVGARDVGLLGGCLAIFLIGPGAYALDGQLALNARWLRRAPGLSPEQRRFAMARARLIQRAWIIGGTLLGLATLAIPTKYDQGADAQLPGVAAGNYDYLPIPPLPQSVTIDRRKAELGRRLFKDPALSADGTIACASCHRFDMGGADGRRISLGIAGQLGHINAPTAFNALYNLRQFWDGRAATLEQQAESPVINPIEMGAQWPNVVRRLQSTPEYQQLFKAIYADGITKPNVLDAIASFERALITPNSPFDRYLRGDHEALSPEAKRGYEHFESLGCISCHQGKNIGGTMFQTMGKMENWFAGREPTEADLGRFNATGNPADKHKFKVPGLRNIALTGPYFHDGSAETLDDAVRIMARYQLGYRLENQVVDELTAFLNALTGELPTETRFAVSFQQ